MGRGKGGKEGGGGKGSVAVVSDHWNNVIFLFSDAEAPSWNQLRLCKLSSRTVQFAYLFITGGLQSIRIMFQIQLSIC